MPPAAQPDLLPAAELALAIPLQLAENGIRYAIYGDTQIPSADLERIVLAVPRAIAAALGRKAYYFVPLVLDDSAEQEFRPEKSAHVVIAREYTAASSELAVCHRNVNCGGGECVFISTRLMQDRFALAFEFYINTGHHFVDAVGVPESFASLVWTQAVSNVRGETSQDAWEQRARALGQPSDLTAEHTGSTASSAPRKPRRKPLPSEPQSIASRAAIQAVDEKARTEYLEAAFSDAIAIYLLSLTVDFDYTELREREYPLLTAAALADRLRHVAQIFPPNAGQEFSIRYRRRNR
jgi:hypothetical protein